MFVFEMNVAINLLDRDETLETVNHLHALQYIGF